MPIEIRGLKVILLLFLYDHQDILENDDIKLENIFIASMVNDLIKGMTHLHKTDLHFHGNLKSSNCVVTSRWVLQITDYGLHELRAAAEKDSIGDHELYRSKFDRVNVIFKLEFP
jgi:tRNA A-37 threonylcarbamoyl transferase component Bud32